MYSCFLMKFSLLTEVLVRPSMREIIARVKARLTKRAFIAFCGLEFPVYLHFRSLIDRDFLSCLCVYAT